MSMIRSGKFVLVWLGAWLLLAALALGTTCYTCAKWYQEGSASYRKAHEDTMGFPNRWVLLAVVLGAGGTAFGMTAWYWARRGGRSWVELTKTGFVFHAGDAGDSIHVDWPDVIKITAGPEPDTHFAALRIRAEDCPRVLKILETWEGFEDLKEKLHEVFDITAHWLGSARRSEVVLFRRG